MSRMQSGGCHHRWGNLGDDCSDRIVRSVSLNNNQFVRVEMRQNGGLCEGCFEGFKHLVWLGPQMNGVSLRVRRIRGMTMSENPTMNWREKLAKPKKAWTALRLVGVGQNTDHVGLGSVHRDARGGNHKTQELNLLCVEQALLGFGVQVVFAKTFQDTLDMDPMIFQ